MKNIFISSTFRDMQAERDLVQERVLPALREEARKYGDNVGVIDLRWGVDTSTLETDEGSAKVLKVCLDEIDRSHPYMLIFLGERYGWIPNGSLIEKAVRERGDKYVTDDFEKSVTALEIEYGALSEQYGDLSRCVVCFREPVSAEMDEENRDIYAEQNEKGKQKLEALKIRIRKEIGSDDRLISYTCKWDESAQSLKDFTSNGQPLEDILVKRYMEMFEKDWEAHKNLSWQEKEQLVFKALMESKIRTFVGRETLLEDYYEKIINANQPIIIRGEVGSGKTAIMSMLIDRMKKDGKKVFSFFSGMASMSKNAGSLVQQMIYFVETELGVEHADKNEYSDAYDNEGLSTDGECFGESELLRQEDKQKSLYDKNLEYLKGLIRKLQDRIYIYIDALDQLSNDEHVENLEFFFATEKIQMVASCTDTFFISASTNFRIQQVEIPMLDVEDAKVVAAGILRADSRDYFTILEDSFLSKKSIGSPLYISLLIQRLNMMDQEELSQVDTAEEIAMYSAKIVYDMPDNLAEAAVTVLKNAIEKISGETDGQLLEIVRFLAVSRTGLNFTDLKKIFKDKKEELSELNIMLLMKYLNPFFYIGEEGRVNFTNKVIREGVLGEIENREYYEKEIKEYIKTLKKNDILYMQEAMYFSRVLKDYELAISLFAEMADNESKILLKAILEEAVNDEGLFYSQLMLQETQNIAYVRLCLSQLVIGCLGISGKEIRTKIVLLESFLHYYEILYENEQDEKNLLSLSICCGKLGEELVGINQPELALGYHMKAVEYAQKLHKGWNGEKTLICNYRSYSGLGRVLHTQGRNHEAIGYYEKALKYAEKLYEKVQSDQSLRCIAISYSNMSQVLNDLRHPMQALEYIKINLEYVNQLCDKEQSEENLIVLSIIYGNMGNVYKNLLMLEDAFTYYQKEVICREKIHEIQQSDESLRILSIGYKNIGTFWQGVGQFDKALIYLEKCVKCREEINKIAQSEGSMSELSTVYLDMANIFSKQDQQEKALSYCEKALKIVEDLYEKNKNEVNLSGLSCCYNAIGEVLKKLNRREEALQYYENGIKYAEELYDIQESDQSLWRLVSSYDGIADILMELGLLDKTMHYYEKELEKIQEVYTIQKSTDSLKWLYSVCFKMAHILKDLYQYDKAFEYYEKGMYQLLMLQEKNAVSFMELMNAYQYIASILGAMGRFEEALNYWGQAEEILKKLYLKEKTIPFGRDYVKLLNMKATCFMKISKMEEAKECRAIAIELAERLYEQTGLEYDKKLLEDSKKG